MIHVAGRSVLLFSALVVLVIAAFTVVLGQESAATQAPHPQQDTAPAHRQFVPALVHDANGGYTAGPTATPTPSPTPTPVGVQDAPNRFFVAANSGDDDNDGSRDAPFQTVAFALLATTDVEDREIYVAAGTYTGFLAVTSPLRLYGSYTPTWERSTTYTSRLRGTDGFALYIESDDVLVTGFHVQSGVLGTGFIVPRHRIAMWVEESENVVLEGNRIQALSASSGQDGPHGSDGDPGNDGRNGQAAGVCPPANSGGSGGSGARSGGKGGTGGAFGGFSGSDGSDVNGSIQGGGGGSGGSFAGGNGGRGGAGDDGTSTLSQGAGGSSMGSVVQGLFQDDAASGSDGASSDRLPGAGGGGGGGGGGAVTFICGSGGGGGGGGGHPAESNGSGGQGGGSSYAIVILDSKVTLTDNEVVTSTAGNGGRGGNAGRGGDGETAALDATTGATAVTAVMVEIRAPAGAAPAGTPSASLRIAAAS
ncbi:MAG: hypothetical protein U5Q44_06785 [Dehalococcoidia bacterium]|nr:hypothetical protein [Dehalococcoidia bacterium]